MSCYSINFANIKSGWYRKTTEENYAVGRKVLDDHWGNICDNILIKSVEEYGTFFTAFREDIIKKIDAALGTNFENSVRYYEYYLATRAYEIDTTKQIWISSYKENQGVKFTCPYCEKHFSLLDCHPDILRTLGIPPTHCRTCNYIVERYSAFWNADVKRRICNVMRSIDRKKNCEFCHKEYSLENDVFT